MGYQTLDEWVAKHAFKLKADVTCHVDAMAEPELDEVDRETLVRLIMMAVRDWTGKP